MEMKKVAKVIVAFVLLLGAGYVLLQAQSETPGELQDNGLRLVPTGRSDAAAVMPPEFFEQPRIREAYTIAQQIPETLNQLYCWCGCLENLGHRSALECFESSHGAFCDICLVNAEIAWEMTQEGITDAAEIQKAIDARLARL